MQPIPNLSFAEHSASGLNSNGASFMASGPGDWNVNVAGSGVALQSGGIQTWMLIAGAVGLYMYWKK